MLISQISKQDDVWVALFQRNNSVFLDFFMRVSILFTRFASTSWHSNRYITSRYELSKLAIFAGATGPYNYCFSHSKKLSAVILSSECERVSIDIEPLERQLTKTLKVKIRETFPSLMLSELGIIMILECLIKVQPVSTSFGLVAGLFGDVPIEIVKLGQDNFAVNFKDKRFYSRIYILNNLFICITREKNQFPLNLEYFND